MHNFSDMYVEMTAYQKAFTCENAVAASCEFLLQVRYLPKEHSARLKILDELRRS